MTRRTGRRPGGEDTRGTILEAARQRFAADGYTAATIRGIARDAGVDPALVHHYFGDKAQLFMVALELPFDPAVLLPQVIGDGPLEEVGERLARLFVAVWDHEPSHSRMLALFRSVVGNEDAGRLLREFIGSGLIGAIEARLDVEDAALRATLAASQVVGAGALRHVLRIEPLASAPAEQVVAWLAPTLQRYLTGPPPGGS